MKKAVLSCILAHFLYIYSSPLLAQSTDNEKYLPELPAIQVQVLPFSQKMGTQILTAEDIAKRPTRNGSLTDLLKNNPNVRFSNTNNTSLAGGELEPENISFHGEKFYNNNFMIDGLANNNNIDPVTSSTGIPNDLQGVPNGNNAWDFPAGGAQSLWIDSHLIGSLEVFDSNISAKYGHFTGGVIDAKIKEPNFKRPSGRISWRSTRDDWASFHIDEKIKDDFEKTNFMYFQPQFTKNFYSASFNQPLNDKTSILLSYNRQESEIPYYHQVLNRWTNQQRLNETYLLKGLYQANDKNNLSLTAIYAPHSSEMYRRNYKDGGYKNQGGGYRANLDWKHLADWGSVKTTIGYQHDKNSSKNQGEHYYPWYAQFRNQKSKTIDWASTNPANTGNQNALQGGYGHTATEKQSITVKQDYSLKPFQFLNGEHHIDFGLEYHQEKADYHRFKDTFIHATPTWNTKVQCDSQDKACIQGEQFQAIRLRYPARDLSATVNRYELYAEDTAKIGRLELISGLRIAYDDFMKNLNISPRFSFTADIFDNEKTKLFGGLNRYHANHLFAYKLKNKISFYEQETRKINTDGTLSDWTKTRENERTANMHSHQVANLDTPYSDEINLGIRQQIADSLWTFKWVKRHSKKSFARHEVKETVNNKTTIVDAYLDNSGWSKAETFSLGIQPTTPISFDGLDVNWALDVSWAKKRKQNTANDYNSTSDDDFTKVIYDGKLMNKADLPSFDYNIPWQANASIDMYFPELNLTWGHNLAYRTGYTGHSSRKRQCPDYHIDICGDYTGNVDAYEITHFSDRISYDMRFAYKQPIFKNQSLELTLDVNNVFDKKMATSSGFNSSINYEMGRNFWLGVAYNF